MEVWRTVPVKLVVTESAAASLLRTIEEFRWAANYVVDHAVGDDGYVVTSKQELHNRTYAKVREQTDLHANLVQAARSRAADALNGVVNRWSRGQYASLPTFEAEFLDYDKRSATFRDEQATLSTVDGRITVEYVLPPEDKPTPHRDYLFTGEFETTGATLHRRDDNWYLHLRTKAEIDDPELDVEHPTVLGVDLNVTGSVAVTSTGQFVASADYLNHVRNRYEQRRGRLQQTGTQSSHRTMKRIGGRLSRWSEDFLHRIANQIVAEAIEHECTHIAVEDLTQIRENIARGKKFQQWAFRRLYEYVKYKAEAKGIAVEQVDPAQTSQRCSKCGFTCPESRDDKRFRCVQCTYEVHADYNAAKNIAIKYVRRGQKSRGGRAKRQLALKSGTMNGNGHYSPASPGA